MKKHHWRHRIEQVVSLSKMSHCPRGQVGCLFLDEINNVVLMDGYNGTEPGDPNLCGGDDCLRTRLKIKSGTQTEVGCGHAETSAANRAARLGIALRGTVAVVTAEPCLNCAKQLYRVGISRLVYRKTGVYTDCGGLEYLRSRGVTSRTFEEEIDAALA